MLDELSALHSEHPGNIEVGEAFANLLHNAFWRETIPAKASAWLGRLRELHREQPDNTVAAACYADCLVIAIRKFYASMDENDLLDQLRDLHREKPREDAFVRYLAQGLYSASRHQTIPEKAKVLLYERRYILDSLKY